MAVEMFMEIRSKDNDDRAPWLIVGRENDRIYVLLEGTEPAVYDDRAEAEERLELIRAGEPDPEPPAKSDCFLTTACEVVLGERFRDDGVELQTLREHRDRIAAARPELREVVAEYYEYAPQIVTEINAAADSDEVYRRIFDEMVTPTNALLTAGDDDAALDCYYRGFRKLRVDYAV